MTKPFTTPVAKTPEELQHILPVRTWKTPATEYPLMKNGSAEITRKVQRRGYYRMEAVKGYTLYHVYKPIQITDLRINGKVVMTDEPINWLGMQALAEHSKGKVLTAGLGLGLLVHALLRNDKVTRVDVVEINQDVIQLVGAICTRTWNLLRNSTLPTPKVNLHRRDIYDFNVSSYDTIILDLWVKDAEEDWLITYGQMLSAFNYFSNQNPAARIFIWGVGDEVLNPAIDREVRLKLPKEYWYP